MRVLISADQIRQRIAQLAAQIDADYPQGVVLVGILKGSFIFLADLARALTVPCRIEFMGISSYGKGTTSSGEVKVTKDLDSVIEGRDVLVVEDIVDSGITLTYLQQLLAQRKPRSIRIAALLDKPERRQRPVEVRYSGFSIPDKFVVGYGLDFDEQHRQWPDVRVLDED